jgi:hypothetical protein
MKIKNIVGFFFLVLTVIIVDSTSTKAQNRFDALRFSQTSPSYDAVSILLGGGSSARFNGFGSVYQNPATAAMTNKSVFSFGLGFREVTENSTYMGSQTNFSDQQTGLTNLGYLFRFPTITGSLVIGGAYNQIADFNRTTSVDVFNNQHTISDFFLIDPGDQYFETAFNAFALEYDDFFDEYFNVLRADGNFRGMHQYGELRERGQMGEFNIFMATEFQPNLFLGGSVGIVTGEYSYRRTFIEEDRPNNYANAVYDVDLILNEDKITASIAGVNARVGVLYAPFDGFSIGMSYTTKTKLDIDERYSTFIQTDYKTSDSDGFNRYDDTYSGEFEYEVYRPATLSAGVSIGLIPYIDADISVERVNYSRIEFRGLGILSDINENQTIRSEFDDVYNLRAGITLKTGSSVMPRFGYAYNPSPRKSFDAGITYLSAGAGIQMGNNFTLDVGLQFASFKDELDLYNYGFGTASVSQTVEKLQGVIGLTYKF